MESARTRLVGGLFMYMYLVQCAYSIPGNVTAPNGTVEYEMSNARKTDMLNMHIKLRRESYPKASNMQPMVWNDTLAYLAKKWAQTCPDSSWPISRVHGQVPEAKTLLPGHEIGQNIFFSSVLKDTTDFGWAVQYWYDEIYMYNYCRNVTCEPGKDCLHYSQVMWADTNQVGCGFHVCPPDSEQMKLGIVCNYLEGGNIIGRKPYKLKDPNACTKCGVDFNCDHGLPIYEDCTCKCQPLYKGPKCNILDCGNLVEEPFCNAPPIGPLLLPGNASCTRAFYMSFVTKKEETARKLCPVKCGYCKAGTTKPWSAFKTVNCPRPDAIECFGDWNNSINALSCEADKMYIVGKNGTRTNKLLKEFCPYACGVCRVPVTTVAPPTTTIKVNCAFYDVPACGNEWKSSLTKFACDNDRVTVQVNGKARTEVLKVFCPHACGVCSGGPATTPAPAPLIVDCNKYDVPNCYKEWRNINSQQCNFDRVAIQIGEKVVEGVLKKFCPHLCGLCKTGPVTTPAPPPAVTPNCTKADLYLCSTDWKSNISPDFCNYAELSFALEGKQYAGLAKKFCPHACGECN